MSAELARVSAEMTSVLTPGEAVSALLTDLLNATGSRWGRMTFETSGLPSMLACNFGTLVRTWPTDPWTTGRPKVLGRAVRGEAYLPEATWKQSDYFLSVLRPAAVEPDHSLVASIACADGEIVVFLARGAWDGRYSAEEQARAEMFLPTLARTVALGWTVEAERQSAAGGKAALDSLSLGVLVVDAGGAVRHDNHAALLLLQTADWLAVENGDLTTIDPAQREGLQRCIQTACREVEARPALIRLQGRSGAWATALVSTLDVDGPQGRTRRAMITVRVNGDQDDRLPPIRQLFGFTEAEARLAWALVNGETVAEFAAARAVSINTARVQLTSVMRKTRTRRQAELVALLGSIPPLRLAPPSTAGKRPSFRAARP